MPTECGVAFYKCLDGVDFIFIDLNYLIYFY